jgi:ABC-type Fe3+ transport system substrate-binding protein
MKNWITGIGIVGAFLLIVGVPMLRRPAEARLTLPDSATVTVITPHNEQIRHEVGRAFARWHQAKYGEPAACTWIQPGGSSDVQRILEARFKLLAREGREQEGAGFDIVFGGGDYLFGQLKRGVKVTDISGKERTVSVTEPPPLDEAVILDAFPAQRIADKPLYDPDHHWFGVVLSSFGILFNRVALADRGLPEPTGWEDLTDPRYFGWVGLADAAHSGTLRATYEAIVQRYGWERGWPALRRICANARYFASDSGQVPLDVSSGEVAAGLCVDFFAREQASVVGGNRLGYVAPAGSTVVNADPVAMLRGAPNRKVAGRFIEFLISHDGQKFWGFAKGTPDGPEMFDLRRPPIRREFYEPPLFDRLIDKVDPYQIASPLPPGTPSYFVVLPVVMEAMAVDVHDDLKRAWQRIMSETEPTRRERMVALFDALPFTAEELAAAPARWKEKPSTKLDDRLQWMAFFRGQYAQVMAVE